MENIEVIVEYYAENKDKASLNFRVKQHNL